jgi:aryl-alcohol dehydrogenase-like predicted oxidoreductase
MDYRTLGRTGLEVSTICLGGMTFGEADEKSFMHGIGSDEKTSFDVLDNAIELGINFIDVADVYGQDGLSERVLGKWLARTKTRDRIVLATKFRFRMSEGVNGSGASRYRIVRTVEDSLRRLQTDRIDLYQIHMQDVNTPEDETLRALDDLVHAGKVLYIGASNYAAYRLTESQWVSRTEHLARFVSLQMQYNLLTRDLEREHVPLCAQYGIGIIPWAPLARGVLSGKYQRGQAPPQGSRFDARKDRVSSYDNERTWRVVEAVDKVAKAHAASPSQVALAWLLHKPTVSSVIAGARTVEQLKDNAGAASLKLGTEAMKALDDASATELPYPYETFQRIQGRW